jgi:hypothetical protein
LRKPGKAIPGTAGEPIMEIEGAGCLSALLGELHVPIGVKGSEGLLVAEGALPLFCPLIN